MKAILVSQFEPTAVGHGGNHRAFQIQHDLAQAVGAENVIVYSYVRRRRDKPPAPPVWRRLARQLTDPAIRAAQRLGRRAGRLLADDPVALAMREMTPHRRYAAPAFRHDYETLVAGIEGPALCVIEHFEFADLVDVNRPRGIPTAICIQNIETFDIAAPLSSSRPQQARATALDFSNELLAIGKCDARLFISRVEAAVIGGLGFSSVFYPYLPVGEIRQRLQDIRRQRQDANPDEHLLLMVGSGSHHTTRSSFEWFIDQARTHGLPGGIRIVVAGAGTEELLSGAAPVEGLEIQGWIEQEELDELLVRATAVLVPQLYGFGALTRLPELACAGIPVVVSRHPTLALDPPPGLVAVNDDWAAWAAQIERLARSGRRDPAPGGYDEWEQRQPSPLRDYVRRLPG